MTDAENYELGRVDERIGVDGLLADVEALLEQLGALGTHPDGLDIVLDTVLARIRVHRSATELIRSAARKRGWFGPNRA